MLLFLLTYFVNVLGVQSHSTRFVFSVLSDVRCTAEVYLSMTSLESDGADVTIWLPRRPDVDVINTTVEYGLWTNVTLPSSVRIKTLGVHGKVIELRSSGDISLYITEPIRCGDATTQVLPSTALGTRYVVQGFKAPSTPATGFVSITAPADHTQVTVSLSAVDNASLISYNGDTYRPGETLHATVDGYQTLVMNRSGGGLSRVDIAATAPVAVFVREDARPGPVDDVGHVTTYPPSTGRHLVPVSRWGRRFIAFPFSRRSDTIQITAAENDTLLSVGRRRATSTRRLTTQLTFSVHLPLGDFVSIQSDKPVMVLQYSADDCTPAEQADRSCTPGGVLMLPSVDEAGRRFVLRPLDKDAGRPVKVNLVVRTKQRDSVSVSEESFSAEAEDGAVTWPYGVSGEFSLYRLHLLASSGILEHRGDGVLVVTPTLAFIHVSSRLDQSTDKAPGGAPERPQIANDDSIAADPEQSADVGVNEISGVRARPRGHPTRGGYVRTLAPTSPSTVGYVVDLTSTTSASSVQHRHASSRKLDDAFEYKVKAESHLARLPSGESSGAPFVVKAAKGSDELNLHEVESRLASRDRRTDDPGLDLTVIAVIVSLASAVVLAVVFVFGFLMAEFLCRRNPFKLSQVAPYLE